MTTEAGRGPFAAVAAAWEANADWIAQIGAPVQRWLIDHLDPKPGETILELGAGPGDTGFEAAKKIGAEGRLISTDLAPEMVDVAKRRAEELGVSNAEFRAMDAQRLDVDDSSMDGVIHRYGPMLLPDPAASFADVRRALRDGGRYVAATFAGPENNAWLTTMAMSVMQSGVQMPEDANPMGPGGPFSLADPDALRGRIGVAGFDDVLVERMDLGWEFADLDEAWQRMSTLAGPLAMLLAGLDDEKRETVKRNYQAAVEQYHAETGYSVPGQALCVFAR